MGSEETIAGRVASGVLKFHGSREEVERDERVELAGSAIVPARKALEWLGKVRELAPEEGRAVDGVMEQVRVLIRRFENMRTVGR